MQQALEGLTRLAKGLSLNLCTRSRPQIGELLHRPLTAALQVPLVCSRLLCCSSLTAPVIQCHVSVCIPS